MQESRRIKEDNNRKKKENVKKILFKCVEKRKDRR